MFEDKPATIMMVDDHPLLRKGLNQLIELEDDLEVIGEASSGKKPSKWRCSWSLT